MLRSIILSVCLPSLVHSLCYFPNGDIADNNFPCTDDTEESFCCGRGGVCLEGGLCSPPSGNYDTYVRGSCTDKTWRSSSCPLYCVSNNRFGGAGIGQCSISGDTVVLFCTTGSDEGNARKCDTGDSFEFPAKPRIMTTIGVVERSTTTLETSVSSETSLSSSTEASLDTSKSSQVSSESTAASGQELNGSDGNNHLAIGLGVGLGVGGGILLASIILVLFWRRKRNGPDTSENEQAEILGPSTEQKPLSYSREAELPGDYTRDPTQYRVELEHRERHHEMP